MHHIRTNLLVPVPQAGSLPREGCVDTLYNTEAISILVPFLAQVQMA